MKYSNESNAYFIYSQLCEEMWKETISNPFMYLDLDRERVSYFDLCRKNFDPEIERLINPSLGKAETLRAYCTLHRAMRGVDFCLNYNLNRRPHE